MVERKTNMIYPLYINGYYGQVFAPLCYATRKDLTNAMVGTGYDNYDKVIRKVEVRVITEKGKTKK